MQRPQKDSSDPPQRGSALIMIVFTVFLIMLVVSAIFALSRQNFMSVNKDEYNAKADYGAKAGLEHAIAKLADDNTVGSVVANGNAGESFNNIPLESDADVSYSLQMINNDLPYAYPNPNLVTAPDGLQIPPQVVWVKSTGTMRDRANSASSSLIKLVGYQRPLLKQSLFGINLVEISGNSTVDAYDSRTIFAMPADPAPRAKPFAPMGRRGDVGTNATAYVAGVTGIKLDSGSTVHGQLRAGVGSLSAAAVMTISGVQDHLEDPLNPRVVSEEATQVPRFVIGKNPMVSGFGYPHHLVAQDLAAVATPTASGTPATGWMYKPILAASPTPASAYGINDTKNPGSPGTPTPDPPRTGYANLRIVNPGFYDLSAKGGTVNLEDVVFRAGARYHFAGDVTFAGKINLAFHDPKTSTAIDPADGPLPAVIYIDGGVKFAPGVEFNMDWADEDTDGDTSEPLPPRRLQIYTANDKGEQFQIDTDTVTVGGSGTRSKVSGVFVGSNMKLVIDNTDYWGGVQALDVSVTGGSKVYFDVALWGTPLEGRGQMAVLLNTVQVYTPLTAPAPPSSPSTSPASSPSYTSGYTTGYCSPIIPLPQYIQQCY